MVVSPRKIPILFRWLDCNHYTLAALVGLLDERLDPSRFHVDTLESLDGLPPLLPGILAYSFPSTRFAAVAAEIKQLKEAYGKDVTVICGGPHATADPEGVLAAGADYVFTGEAEESLPRFLENFADGQSFTEPVIPPAPLEDFDRYPPFAWRRTFFSPIELRRGCAGGCAFCQTPRLFSTVRERSVGYVAGYARRLKEADRHSVYFTLQDGLAYGSDGAVVNLGRIESLLSSLAADGFRIHFGDFPSELSPRTLARNPEAAALLKKYVTNNRIVIGAQSGSDRMLALMRRSHTVADVREAVRILSACRFNPMVDILFGFPGETKDDRRATLEFMRAMDREHDARFNLHYFLPLPGTPAGERQPEPVEPETLEALDTLLKRRVARGDFFEQMRFSAGPSA